MGSTHADLRQQNPYRESKATFQPIFKRRFDLKIMLTLHRSKIKYVNGDTFGLLTFMGEYRLAHAVEVDLRMIGYTALFEIILGLLHICPFYRHLQSELTRLKVKDPLRSCEVAKEDIVLGEDGESLVSCRCHITVLLMYI